MTTLPPNADELVSAYVDGEAAPDEVELVESNAELLARAASLRTLSERLAAPISPPAALRETHLASALAAFDELIASGPDDTAGVAAPVGDPPGATHVASLDDARRRRRPRRLNGLIAAAAAALLLFVGITVLTVGRTNEAFDTADDTAAQVAVAKDTATNDSFSANAAADDAGGLTMAAPAPAAVEEAGSSADAAAGTMSEAPAAAAPQAPAAEAAMADEAADGEADSSSAARALSPTDDAIFFGSFPNTDDLGDFVVAQFSIDELRTRAVANAAGLFPTCQASIATLRGATGSTLVGTAEVDDVFLEVHLVPKGSKLLLIESLGCAVADEVTVSAN